MIDTKLIRKAKENLVVRRDTHLDQLTDKLQEDRVFNAIQPILKGEGTWDKISPDDIQYCIDLGLVKREGNIKISNSIYSEIIPRELIYSHQVMMVQETLWYLDEKNRILFFKLRAGVT